MKLIINDITYTVLGQPSLGDPILFRLSEEPPNDLGNKLTLTDDSGFVLCEILVSDYKHWTITDTSIGGTNYENEDPGPGPEPPPMPTYDEMTAAIKEGVDGV